MNFHAKNIESSASSDFMAEELKCLDAYLTINKWGYFLLLVLYSTFKIKMIPNSSDSKRNDSPSILIPLFSNLISGGGDFLAEGSFLGTSKCEGMLLLLLLWLGGRGLAWLPNSCFTTTGGNTVLLVITFFDVEGTADGVLPKKTDAIFCYNSRKSRFCFYAHRGIPLLSLSKFLSQHVVISLIKSHILATFLIISHTQEFLNSYIFWIFARKIFCYLILNFRAKKSRQAILNFLHWMKSSTVFIIIERLREFPAFFPLILQCNQCNHNLSFILHFL